MGFEPTPLRTDALSQRVVVAFFANLRLTRLHILLRHRCSARRSLFSKLFSNPGFATLVVRSDAMLLILILILNSLFS